MPLGVLKYSPTNCLFVLRLTAKDGGTMVPAAPGKSIVVKVPGAGAWARAVGTPASTRDKANTAHPVTVNALFVVDFIAFSFQE
jgi:hypothetical protein